MLCISWICSTPMSIRPPSRRFSGVPEAKAPKAWRDWLEAGDIGRLIRQASKQLPASAKSKKSMLKQLRYFANNAPQMRYAEYREKKFLAEEIGRAHV